MNAVRSFAAFAVATTAFAGARGAAAQEMPAAAPEPALSSSPPTTSPTSAAPLPMALGLSLDLLPVALSAANGELGYAPQIWWGVGHVRLRLVGAHLQPPEAVAFAPRGFRRPTLTAFATILDYTFGKRFDGFWIGSGFEVWQQSIEHDGVAGKATWSSTVFTVGAGYIWRVVGDFYVDPWLGAHAVLNPQDVPLGGFTYTPLPLQAEASLKIGWFVPVSATR